MGDWVVGELERNGLRDYSYQPFPGAGVAAYRAGAVTR
jgi:hypothetical protein